MDQLETKRHAVFKLQYHLVLVTKYRRKCINADMLVRLKQICFDMMEKWDCLLLEVNGESDHIHLLFSTPPSIKLSTLINNIKTVTSRYMRKEFPERLREFYLKNYFWSASYCIISSGGASIAVLKKYIESQNMEK